METIQKQISLIERLQSGLKQAKDDLKNPEIKPLMPRRLALKLREVYKLLYGENSQPYVELQDIRPDNFRINTRKQLIDLVNLTDRFLNLIQSAWEFPSGRIRKIFIGHGRNSVWLKVVKYLEDNLGYETDFFEKKSRVSSHILDFLGQALESCNAAVIVMTKDDYTSNGASRSRQNVIHEIGLFQGKHGIRGVIIFQEEGVEEFSNIAGLQTIKYKSKPEEGFHDLEEALSAMDSS